MDYKVTTPPVCEPIDLNEAKEHLNIDEAFTAHDDLINSLIKVARERCEEFHGWSYICRTITAKLDKFTNCIILPSPPLVSVSSITYIDTAGETQTLATTIYAVDTTSEQGQITLAYNQSWPTVRGDHHCITITYIAGYACKFTTAFATDANKLTIFGRTFTDGDVVRLDNTEGDLPAPLAADTDYYVVNSVASTSIELATTAGGDPIDLTDDGTGTSFVGVVPEKVKSALKMTLTNLYENRGDGSEKSEDVVPSQAKSSLWPDRIVPV